MLKKKKNCMVGGVLTIYCKVSVLILRQRRCDEEFNNMCQSRSSTKVTRVRLMRSEGRVSEYLTFTSEGRWIQRSAEASTWKTTRWPVSIKTCSLPGLSSHLEGTSSCSEAMIGLV